jgi:sugar-specific transcriptional regulator TrmB/DNA-binding CsgD family transcriptional regulator
VSRVLSVLGVDGDALRVYEALLELGPATDGELARECGLPDAVVASSLAELKRLELVLPQPPARWVASPPDLALAGVLMERRQELDRAQAEIERLRARYAEVEPGTRLHGVLEVVEGPSAIAQRLLQIERSATHLVRSFVPGDATVAIKGEDNPADLEALNRGVAFRVLVEGEALLDDLLRHDTRAADQAGMTLRLAHAGLPGRMVIADDSVALVQLDDAEDGVPRAAVVLDPVLLGAFRHCFDVAWSLGLPLSSPTDAVAGPESLDPVDRRLVSLLMAGYTDAAVARQLELSERTVQRRISALMLSLGVGTRIQLGWQVRDRDWV